MKIQKAKLLEPRHMLALEALQPLAPKIAQALGPPWKVESLAHIGALALRLCAIDSALRR